MIYLRLAGGLGNQLFQLAAAMHVSECTGQGIVPLTNALSRYAQKRAPDSLRLFASEKLLVPPPTLANKALSWSVSTGRVGRWLPVFGISDKSLQPANCARLSGSLFAMDGYFQRGWSLPAFEGAMRRFQVAAIPLAAQNRLTEDECAIHIRGGDFLSHKLHQVVDVDYYVTAIRSAHTMGWSKFAVLTDDLVHARTIVETIQHRLPGIEIRSVPPSSDALTDLGILRSAPARIIGNSTFAWWATALDKDQAPTWSPSKFLRNVERDFFLDWEIQLAV